MSLEDILDALDKDGAEVDLEDGRTVRLSIQQDIDSDPRDDEFFGTYSKYAYDYSRDGKTPRPDGFDGNAEKIEVAQGYWVWWQPPKDGPKRDTPEFREMRQAVLDLWHMGYVSVVLEITKDKDAYHRPIVVDVASLSGIDSLENGYLREVVGELLAEVGITEEGAEQ